MKAVDTNVLVRVLTGDDEKQAALAAETLAQGVFVGRGVLMEVEWVLRSTYKWPRARIVAAMGDLFREASIATKDKVALSWAVGRYAKGADWADMLHLLDASGCDAFLSFEARLAAEAGLGSPVRVERLQ